MANALFAGLVTGLTYALLFLAVKALFFSVDDGYRDASSGGPLDVHDRRRLRLPAVPRGRPGAGLRGGRHHGRRDVQRLLLEPAAEHGRLTFLLSVGGALGGGFMYGITNRRKPEDAEAAPAR